MGRRRKDSEPQEAASAPRIVGGDLRRRTLAFAPAARTRPMKDRVRESLFDLLGPRVRGAVAIDLFAGTGALGFESISRGAARAVFVERHFPTADAIRRSARSVVVVEGDGAFDPAALPDAAVWEHRPVLPAVLHFHGRLVS